MAVSDWSSNAVSNTTIDGINIDENCAPGNLNDSDRAIMANIAKAIGTYDVGTLPVSTSLTPFVINKTATGNASGTSDWRTVAENANFVGGFGATQINARNTQHNILHTAGTVAAAVAWQGYSALGVPSSATTTGNVGTVRGIEYHISHTGTGTITDLMAIYLPGPDLNVGVGTVTNAYNFRSGDMTAGSGSRITAQAFGYFQGNCSTSSTPITASYGSEMSSGTGRWSLYFTGGAASFLAGAVRLGGTVTAPTERLEVVGKMLSFSQGGIIGGVGYGTGTGGTVSQITSKATGVTLDKPCGQITLNNASLASNTSASFTLTNSTIAATDVVVVNIAQNATADAYVVTVTAIAAGSCRIQVRNVSGGALAENLVLNFSVMKAVSA